MKFNERYASADWHSNLALQTIRHKIIGLGGIGSHLAFKLSRIGAINIDLYDFDKVENHNIGGQLYSHEQINQSKAYATREFLMLMKGQDQDLNVYDFNYKVNHVADLFNYYSSNFFVCVDNMKTRINIANSFKSYKNSLNDNAILIESRLGPTGYEIYFITKDTIDFYLEHCLFTDEEANAVTCSYQQTTHVASALASRIVNLYTNYLNNEVLNQEHSTDIKYFPVPFYLRENCDLLTIKIANTTDEYEIITS